MWRLMTSGTLPAQNGAHLLIIANYENSLYQTNQETTPIFSPDSWILYKDADFKGKQWVVTEGDYSSAKEFDNDEISSLRPVKEVRGL